jgi:tetratricopeptide (TPR) repeat protein
MIVLGFIKINKFHLFLALNWISWSVPEILIFTLIVLTFLCWLFNYQKESFRIIYTKGNVTKYFEHIRISFSKNPQEALKNLTSFCREYPDYQPAFILMANYHFESGNFVAALFNFKLAFKIGYGKASNYHRAAYSASKLGDTRLAISILRDAESVLPKKDFTGVLFFNLGCYLAKLGPHYQEEALECLRKAIKKGFNNGENYRTDPDLDSLRSTDGFLELLKSDFTIRFKCPKCLKILKAKEKSAKMLFKCPKCKTLITPDISFEC